MSGFDYDLCIIGGGINGAGIARDAAGRGLSVLLLEAGDLACATSSASTKLIHGGLRYLEFFEFRLVRDSLKERETLLSIAPHVIWPMDFILPHFSGSRPFWLLQLGLFLYDNLAPRRTLHASYVENFHEQTVRGAPLASYYEKGLCYADCWVDDARLVVLNALDAQARGAKILTRCACTKIQAFDDHWQVEYHNKKTDGREKISCAMVINAAGPWVTQIIEQTHFNVPSVRAYPKVRLVKGSHIIVNRAFEGDHAYILQQPDKRIVFAIPYEHDYTLIGTTEENFTGDAYDPRISDAELEYLCTAFSKHFKKDISREDVLWTYSGVRPLFDDGGGENRKVTRDFVLHVHEDANVPMLSVFGGKLTTYRILAEKALDKLLARFHRPSASWTGEAPLPGGDFPDGNFQAFLDSKIEEFPWLEQSLLHRYARAYGTRMDRFLGDARRHEDLGKDFGAGLYEAEAAYLIRYEFALEVEDILWRRSKLGVHMNEQQVKDFEKAFPKILKKALQL
jgi:glycerol-3-phosphate dehydrogenase